MAQRNSEYARIDQDHYATPAWVTRALIDVEQMYQPVWDCAPGDGHMVRALEEACMNVLKTPKTWDFRNVKPAHVNANSIMTNPPFNLADEFVEHALTFGIKVAMLLPVTWDTAKRRTKFFRDCDRFHSKHILMRRIRWENLQQKKAGPSTNHAWYVWSAEKDTNSLFFVPQLRWL